MPIRTKIDGLAIKHGEKLWHRGYGWVLVHKDCIYAKEPYIELLTCSDGETIHLPTNTKLLSRKEKANTNYYIEERWLIPMKVDRKKEVEKIKKMLPKNKNPLYVEQFGLKRRSDWRKKKC